MQLESGSNRGGSWEFCVSVCGDEEVLEENFARSPAARSATGIQVLRNFPSVVAAYNHALDESSSDVVVFCHPDVYVPQEWTSQFLDTIDWLESNAPDWGVVGFFGSDHLGRPTGFTYSVGLGSFIGKPFGTPQRVRTIDEFAFAVKRSTGIRFDESLPGPQSQLCATDICLQAELLGHSVFVSPAFLLHNSNGWRFLPLPFWRPYLYIRKKWSRSLPVSLPYAKITRACLPMAKNTLKSWIGFRRGYRTNSRIRDIGAFFATLRRDLRCALFGTNADQNDIAGANSGASFAPNSGLGCESDA